MRFVMFDDEKWQNFFPLTFTRSCGDLRCGVLKLRQRISAFLETEIKSIIVPEILADLYQERHPDWQINKPVREDTIFINSRLRISDKLSSAIHNLQADSCLVYQDEILAARCVSDAVSCQQITDSLSDLRKINWPVNATWKYIWELISANGEMIVEDFENFFEDKDNFFETELGVSIINPYNIWLGEGSKLRPGVVLDASEGPIIIDENARVMSNSVLIGPLYIGKSSLIKAGAKIYEGTSIGPVCKIGGEVEASIFQAFANKQHDGFLGHSYIGEWVNIGADTNNSDLKNNYQPVSMFLYPQKKKVNSECQFLGTVIGDHSKTGINCTINTGTNIGVGCNLIGGEIIAGHIPSFSWGEATRLKEYVFNKFADTCQIVKARRQLSFSDKEKELYSKIRQMELAYR